MDDPARWAARLAALREYLADASAVQLTSQISGITGALKKIGALTEGFALKTRRRAAYGHAEAILSRIPPPLLDRTTPADDL